MPRRSTRAAARALYRECAHAGANSARPKRNNILITSVRALYEDTVVPVHEIAQIVGVTQRTVYKYAARYGWKQRYGRALVRGDRHSVAACREAEQQARAAQREAELGALSDARSRALRSAERAMVQLTDYRKERERKPPWQRPPADDPAERGFQLAVDFALEEHAALMAEWRAKLGDVPD